jgi:hypothetical protein
LEAFVFKHFFVHKIELRIMGSVDDLLGGFSAPYLWDQLLQDILLRLFDYSLTLSELLLQLVVLRSSDHPLLLCLLPKSCVGILVLPIWVFPELADERLAFLLVSSGLPVRYYFLFKDLFADILL